MAQREILLRNKLLVMDR